MALPSRTTLLAYAAIAVALLLVGARWVSSSGAEAADESTLRVRPAQAAGGAVSGRLVVHVAGGVARPGVYRLPPGSRVTDAVKRAGGPARRADPGAINLAAALTDGQQVVVPLTSPTGTTAATASRSSESEQAGPISLGTATTSDLEQIEGIGPVTAEKIVEFRDSRGGVASISDLEEVSGIGPATVESLSAALQP